MSIGDSTVTEVQKKNQKMNPFRSRSTILCICVLLTLITIACLAMKSGFFNVEFASMCLLLLREIIAQALGHQLKADAQAGNQTPGMTTVKLT